MNNMYKSYNCCRMLIKAQINKKILSLCVWLERSPSLLVNTRFYSENKNDLAQPMSNDDAKDNTQKKYSIAYYESLYFYSIPSISNEMTKCYRTHCE